MLDVFLLNKSRIDDQYVTKVINEYKRDNPDFENYRRTLIQISSDPAFPCPAYDLALDYSSQAQQVFMYEFKYKSPITYQDLDPSVGVAVHADDLAFVFGMPLANKVISFRFYSSINDAFLLKSIIFSQIYNL